MTEGPEPERPEVEYDTVFSRQPRTPDDWIRILLLVSLGILIGLAAAMLVM